MREMESEGVQAFVDSSLIEAVLCYQPPAELNYTLY